MKFRCLFILLIFFVSYAQALPVCIGLVDNKTDQTIQLRGVTTVKPSPQRALAEVGPNQRIKLEECAWQKSMFRTSIAVKGNDNSIKLISDFTVDSPKDRLVEEVLYHNLYGDKKTLGMQTIYDAKDREDHGCLRTLDEQHNTTVKMKIIIFMKKSQPVVEYECLLREDWQVDETRVIDAQ